MKKKKLYPAIAAALVISMSGCGDTNTPSNEKFAEAINNYYKSKGKLCTTLKYDLKISGYGRPNPWPTADVHQLDALEKVGLLTSTEESSTDRYGTVHRTKHYTPSEQGKQYIQLPEGYGKPMDVFVKPEFCWGTVVTDKVISWTPVTYVKKSEHGQDHLAVFTYKLETPAWANSEEVKAAFSLVKTWADGEGKRELQHHIEATKDGWVDLGLPLM
ncbi:MAG TPA: hypothetical protein GXX48_17160 [Ochrobactrum intermedium]|uniref:Lipoprotein n=1 Tax=Brucella intermedia TaxID=94625 RepID=A0A7V6U116_9HYPH|nr:hypothetical protein [Brucella intermedia]HHV69352.1 hypothetical protein [Brucella intermedia]